MKKDLQVPREDFEDGFRLVALRYFAREPEARVYAARLKAAGIQSYLSNTYALTALPLAGNGIGLHVRDVDLSEATRLLVRVEHELKKVDAEQSFHDADLEEIMYQKELHRPGLRISDKLSLFLLGLMLSLLILRAVIR